MYIPPAYQETDPATLWEFLRRHPLGTLVNLAAGEFEANPLPFFLDMNPGGSPVLLAHVARENPVWQHLRAEARVLVIFQGDQGYISPGWYPGKAQNNNQVPTWNYQAVHIRGTVTVHDDPRFVRGVVARLVTKQESTHPNPWKMTDTNPSFIDDELKKVVGLHIRVEDIQGKFKLSQNRSPEDRAGAAAAVRATGNPSLAAEMEGGLRDPTEPLSPYVERSAPRTSTLSFSSLGITAASSHPDVDGDPEH